MSPEAEVHTFSPGDENTDSKLCRNQAEYRGQTLTLYKSVEPLHIEHFSLSATSDWNALIAAGLSGTEVPGKPLR